MNKTKKIKSGRYEYRSYIIQRFGYYHPEHRVCWEGIDQEDDAVAHGFTKKEVMLRIDHLLDRR